MPMKMEFAMRMRCLGVKIKMPATTMRWRQMKTARVRMLLAAMNALVQWMMARDM